MVLDGPDRSIDFLKKQGKLTGARRDEMIAVFRGRFGELSGPIALGFPKWKIRWDYSHSSGQTCKTFIAPDGTEFKLLMELECMLGLKVHGGTQREIDEIAEEINSIR